MVVAPGTHTIKVKYTILDAKANKTLTLTKSYGSCTLVANTIYDIPVNLSRATVYDCHNYYMWDAVKNYWFGHEWDTTEPWQPTENDGENENIPWSKEDDPSRWYHEAGTSGFEASVNPIFSKLPNANEIDWYVVKGAPHWDNTTQWKAFGKTYTGGLWLKKLSVIAKENHKTLDELKNMNHEGKDMRLEYWINSVVPSSGKPKDSELSDYFFLPALGFYDSGSLTNFGSEGDYWSSTATFYGATATAYGLHFESGTVNVFNLDRTFGIVAQPFE